MEQHINIISINIPYPANYGGVIDIYHKIDALYKIGVKIHLHCFLYNREKSAHLDELCEEVFYYKRKTGILSNLSLLPYNVIGRKNDELLQNLLKNNYPILFEGLHTCYYLSSPLLKDRLKIFRECNIEHDYYWELAKAETSLWKKLFFKIEGYRFKRYEAVVEHANCILCVSQTDASYLKKHYPNKKILFMPCFHENETIHIEKGISKYILYHGNLSVAENEKAALYLIQNIFAKIPYSCIIAGLKPSKKLIQEASKYPNITVKANLNESDMDALIRNAQIHTLVTFQPTGLKLKLLNSLFKGRHLIVNKRMIAGSGLQSLCHIAKNSDEIIELCHNLISKEIDKETQKKRLDILDNTFSNHKQADILKEILQKKDKDFFY